MRITYHPRAPKACVLVQTDTTRTDVRFIEGSKGVILSFGTKDTEPTTKRRVISLIRRIVREAKARHIAMCALDPAVFADAALPSVELMRCIGENVHLAAYEFRVYKTKPKEGWRDLEEVVLLGSIATAERAALRVGELVAEEVNACRDLSNVPGGDMTPRILAERIRIRAQGTAIKVRVLDVKAMKQFGMGAILGVGRGAHEQPRFIVMEYVGGKKKQAPVVLVGKGITFDTGGLSLKPADYMLDMHLDMAGGAAVAHALIAAARMKLPVNAIALIPAAENAIGRESYRPGDVLRSMSGKTIDILNTDAEGRVILADALTYAKRYKPALVIDVATLTGAALVALGTKASAVLSPDDTLARRVCDLGETSGDYCWPFPMWEEYKSLVKGRFGDVANSPTEQGRYGGVIGGAMFLAEFVDGYPWVHIDMAPRMTSDKGDHLASGATGEPVRLLVRLLEDHITH